MTRTREVHDVDEANIDLNANGSPEKAAFAKTLNKVIKENGIHQEQLAKTLGISTGSISEYRNGKKEPRLTMIVRLADYLGVDCHYLMTGIHAENYKCADDLGLSEGAIKSIKSLKQMSFLLDALNYFICSTEFKQLVIDLYHFRERLKEAVELAENPATEWYESEGKLRNAQFMEFLATRNFDKLFGRVLKEEIDKSSVIKKSPDGDGFIWQRSFGGKDNG